MKYTADDLWKAIEELRRVDAVHVKRGYHILTLPSNAGSPPV
jgi:hypothetical protein